jgi:glyoxylase I family protein
MPEVIGIDHIYIAVKDFAKSEPFYDLVFVQILGFRKNKFPLGERGELHIQYYNRHFGYVLRPTRSESIHDPYSSGLHHLCLRVNSAADVDEIAKLLQIAGVNATDAKLYSEYAADYVATFFTDPDGIRLEVTNYWQLRRERHDLW